MAKIFYLFFYVISNVNIIIIDENKCSDQVFILRQMEDIKSSLIDFDNTKIEKKENENEGDYSDIDDDENQCNNNETKVIDFDSKLCDIQSKLLILFNGNEFMHQKLKTNVFIDSELFRQMSLLEDDNKICFINSNDPSTYGSFVNNLYKFVSEDDLKVFSKFEYIRFFNIESVYFDIMTNNEWEDKIKTIIYTRFSELIDNDNDYFAHLSTIQNEVSSFIPFWDTERIGECNLIFKKIEKKIDLTQTSHLVEKLKLSSNNHLKYLIELINSRSYWTKNQLDDLGFNHYNFLKEEYFKMILSFCPPNRLANFYGNSKKS